MGHGRGRRVLVGQAAVLCALAIGAASRPAATATPLAELRIALIVSTPVTVMALRVLRQDAVAIWRSSGVTIVWVSERSGTESASGGAPDLIAILLRAGDGDRPARRAALASLDFLDGVPDRRIRVFVDRAQRLLASARSADGVAGLADSDIALGRVLGRVLAHEVGHYVLATTRHTPSGLMQATHAITMLARPDRRPFRLDGVSRARIALGWHAGVVATTADDCSLTAAWLGGR